MNAILPPEKRIPIPRYTKRMLERGEHPGQVRESAQNVTQLSRAIGGRFSNLPSFDPNETDEQIAEKLKERFEIVRLMARDAADGNTRALIVSGPGGVGKTYEIEEELSSWKDENSSSRMFTSAKGYVRATDLFRLLWENRYPNSTIFFDEADTVFFDDTSLNFLKIALDTTNSRILRWGSESVLADEDGNPIPRTFEFEGSAIWATNVDFDLQIARGNKLAPHLEALMTRAHYIDCGMKTKRDYLIRIYQVAEEGELLSKLGLSIQEENDVLTFIEENISSIRELSLRMAIKLGQLRKADAKIGWERIARLTCCRGGQ